MTNINKNLDLKIPFKDIAEVDKNKSVEQIKKDISNNGKSEILFQDESGKKYLATVDSISLNKAGKAITTQDLFDNPSGKQILFIDNETPKETMPVNLEKNIPDPANIDERYNFPTGKLLSAKSTADAGKLPWNKPLDEFAQSLGKGDQLIDNVASMMARVDYKPNSASDNAFRRPVGTVWDGINSKGECSDIHNLGTYMLNQNGVEAYTAQIGRTSGFHNITIYKNNDGKFNIIEYGKVTQTKGDSPEEAMRKFQNDSIGTVYKYVIYKPTKDSFEVRSIGEGRASAVFDKFTTTPELDFNNFVGGKLNTTGMYAGSDGIQVNAPGGFKLTSQVRYGEIQNIGIGKFNTNEKGVTSGFSLIHDKPTGITLGQYQRSTDQYKWLSAGVMYHNPLSPVAKLENGQQGQTNMPTIAPYFGGSYGGEKDLIKNEALRLSVNAFIQGRVAVPFVLTEEGRKITEHSQNGNASMIDFGQVLGFSQLKTGTGANLEFSPWKLGNGKLQADIGYRAKYEIVDPTLISSDPGAFLSNTATAGLKYTAPVGNNANITAKITGQVTDSKFIYEQNRLDANVILKSNNDKWGLGVSGAVTETGFAAGTNGFYMFNDKAGIMGGFGYDSTASQTNYNGSGFNVGLGSIYKF